MDEDRYTRITLRIPRELHAQLEGEAARTSKSLNAEIVARLEQSFAAQQQASNEALMLEMKRTQLLLRRSQMRAEQAAVFMEGSEAAKFLSAHREANADPVHVEEATKAANRAKLKNKHLSSELAGIDGRLSEIDQRLESIGYAGDFSAKKA